MSNYAPASTMVRPTVRVQSATHLNASGRRFLRSVTIVAIATGAVFALAQGFGASDANANVTSASVEFQYITVSAGQTLWSLAEDLAPGQDPRDWIVDVVNLNGLVSAEVQPGQKIALPN